MYPDYFFAALGEEYERFVGVYFERVRHCTVIYQGRMFGKADGGIDLIAISPDTTYLIQCKNWSAQSELHENVVNQLSGSSRVFSYHHPSAKNVVPVVVATCRFASDARLSAQVNKVELLNISYSKGTANGETVLFNRETTTQGYVSPLYALELMPRYGSFVDDKIALIQYPNSALPEDLPKPAEIPMRKPSTSGGMSWWQCCLCSLLIFFVLVVLPVLIAVIGENLFSNSKPTPTRKATAVITRAPTATATPKVTPTPAPTRNPPNHGTYYAQSVEGISNLSSELTVELPNDGRYYCLVFVLADHPSVRVCSIFAHPGKTVTVKMPACTKPLKLYYTCGTSWYGYTDYFGASAPWVTSDDTFDFENYTYTLTLYKTSSGDWYTEDIPGSEVPFLK